MGSPEQIVDLHSFFTWSLGILLSVIVFLYYEKGKEVKALKDEHKSEKKILQDKIDKLYDESINDLKTFDADKTNSMQSFLAMLNKHTDLLEQIKRFIHDKR